MTRGIAIAIPLTIGAIAAACVVPAVCKLLDAMSDERHARATQLLHHAGLLLGGDNE